MSSLKQTLLALCCVTSLGVAGVGCYRPSIADGGFLCGPADACPEGFSCLEQHCKLVTRDAGRVSDAGRDASNRDVGAGDTHLDGNTCMGRVASDGCNSDPSLACDPVCQTGCCANQKCTALNRATKAPTADLGCVMNNPVRGFNELCDISGAGTPQRSDNCGPGLIGIAGNNGAYCLKLCRGDADCDAGSRCEQRSIDAGGAVMASVCGLPKAGCDPFPDSASSGCPANRVCYLVAESEQAGDTTVCEISSGDRHNTSCKFSRECLVGYTCPTTGPGAGICRPVCSHDPAKAMQLCPGATMCQRTGKLYDYCY